MCEMGKYCFCLASYEIRHNIAWLCFFYQLSLVVVLLQCTSSYIFS